jgi:hypothetical protein
MGSGVPVEASYRTPQLIIIIATARQKGATMGQMTNTAIIFIASDILIDGGGFWIDSEGHIHRIPPWKPGTLAKLTVGATMLNNSRHITNTDLSRQVEKIAEEVITGALPQIEEHIGAAIR